MVFRIAASRLPDRRAVASVHLGYNVPRSTTNYDSYHVPKNGELRPQVNRHDIRITGS
jgi:hypothetical protein